MAVIQRPFGGLLTDLDPTQVPSGSADIALNVTVEDGKLAKRAGFEEWEDAVASTSAVVFLDVAYFANGDIYVIAKLADLKMYHRRVYEPSGGSAATSFTVSRTARDATDVGWSFMWADRWHYGDGAGILRFKAATGSSALTAYDAGLATPTFGTTIIAAASGAMEGFYHIYATVRNSLTREESDHSGGSNYIESRLSDGDGAIAVVSQAGITATVTAQGAYEYDQVVYYRELANSGFLGIGAGSAFPCYVAYEDYVNATTGSDAPGLTKGDDALFRERRMVNRGGEPPAGAVGCFNGIYGVYGQVDSYSGKIYFSIPNYPTMVPKRETYSGTMIEPHPYIGESNIGCSGPLTGIVYGGGATVLFTPTETWLIESAGGPLYARRRDEYRGCVTQGACTATPWAVYAMGYRCWLEVSGGALNDIAEGRFRTTLEEIPVAKQSLTRMAYYSHKDQVWAAVVKTGASVAQRILVWDRQSGTPSRTGGPMGALTVYEPANLGSAGITAMCELRIPDEEPVMLIGTSDGRILKFPSGSQDDSTGYATSWRGYFATEGAGQEQVLDGIDIHAGDNVANNVTLGVRAHRTGSDSPAQKPQVLAFSNQIIPNSSIAFDRQDARFWQVQFTSTSAVTTAWEIPSMTFKTRRK